MTLNTGFLIPATARPYNSDDTYPVALANELLGGAQQVATLTDRDNIPSTHRTQGMLVSVLNTGGGSPGLYWLVGGIANVKWTSALVTPPPELGTTILKDMA